MNRDETPIEDAEVERALAALEARGVEELCAALCAGGAAEAAVARPYLELLGLLAHAEEAVEVPPAARQRLLSVLAGDETMVVAAPPRVAPVRRPPASAPTLAPPPRRPSTAGLRLMAAVLAGCALGLGALSGWLAWRLQEERAAWSQEVRLLRGALAPDSSEPTEPQPPLGGLEERLAVLTGAGTELCPLRPPGERPLLPAARGMLYLAAGTGQWFLEADGLAHLEEGTCYHLWFVPEEPGAPPVSGGTFRACPRGTAEVASPEMPPGIRAVFVTLEAGEGSPAPAGPVVLYGDQRLQVL